MSIAPFSKPPTILARGIRLAQTLRREERNDEATIVDRLVKFNQQFTVLPLTDFVERIGVPEVTIRRWVDRAQINAIIEDDLIIVSTEKLRALDEMNGLLADLDETCPPLADNEIEQLLTPERKNWTWIGKEA